MGEVEVSAKTAPLEKSLFIWKFPHAFDHTSRQPLFALHLGYVSLNVR